MDYEYHYEHAWVEPKTNPSSSARPQHNEIQFGVKGCNDAHILLSNNLYDSTSENIYEIVIGGYSNTLTDIRHGHDGIVLQVSTPQIMKCDQFTMFWLSWDEEGSITFGTGLVHTHQMMQYTMPEPTLYRYASFSTYITAALEYRIVEHLCKFKAY